ncbi:MAG: BMP family ABC transporter substrate-binding protein [Actinomycetota bacterium]
MNKLWIKPLALLAVLGLLAAACGSDSEETTEAAAGDDTEESSDDDAMEDEEEAMEDDAMEDEEEAMEDDAMEEESHGDCASDDVLCVGLVTDVGKIDDKSFNQSAWEGVQELETEYGAIVDFIETQDSTDYATNIGSFIDQNYDVIVTVGFALGEATGIAAAENPETYFVGVDQFQGEAVPNVAGLIFNEDKAGFLAGALAGLVTETGTVAQVLGTDLVPPVVAFKEGFEAGVAYTNSEAQVISTYHPGGLDVAFTDPTWGADTARQALDNGADVIFAAGGQTGNGGLAEVAKEGGAAYCIGVDSDQWETVPEAQPCLITSAMKLITPGVFDIVTAWQNGDAPSGNFFGDVGLADYHDFTSVIPAEVQDEIAQLTPQVISGDVPTGYGS